VASLVVGDPAAYLWGGELLLRDGEPAGQVTSAAWGATVGASVGLALVGDRASGTATKDWLEGGTWTVDLAGDRWPVQVSLRAPFDPEGRKLGRERTGATS
jgi:4-methylaminobutanoate oxidase (formaldehyde-forming)